MSEKITKLTKKQEAAMSVYVQKWLGIGTNTDRLDPDRTTSIINKYQEKILDEKPTPVVIFNNPIEAWVAVCYASNGTAINELKDKVENYFVNGDTSIDTSNPVYPYQDGSLYSSVISFYDFFINEVGIEVPDDLREKFDCWSDTTELGLIYPLDNVCIVSEKPSHINLNDAGEVHCENGPAINYEGFGDFIIYSLNGVTVPEWLVMTPEEDLKIEDYHKIKNADVRTEFVRKFGVERMLDHFGKKVDTFENYNHEWWNKSEYELWDMASAFDGVSYAPHLKMLNQTTKIWHVEAVSPNCSNLSDAIKERFGGRDFTISAIA